MKIIHYFSFITIFFAFILGIYILFLLFYPLKPIVFLNSPFPVKTQVVKRGMPLIYTVSHCKYITAKANVSISFVNSLQYTLPPIEPSVPKGCNNRDIMTIIVPKDLPPNTYHLNITVTEFVNPFRIYTVTVETQEFQVIE